MATKFSLKRDSTIAFNGSPHTMIHVYSGILLHDLLTCYIRESEAEAFSRNARYLNISPFI